MEKNSYLTVKGLLLSMILFLYIIICYFFKDDYPALLHWLGYFILFYGIYTWKIKTGSKWFSAYTIFFLFFVCFNYGQPLMWALNIHKPGEIGTIPLFFVSGYTPSPQELIDTQWYVCLGMLIFHLGVLLFTKKRKGADELSARVNVENETVYEVMRKVGAFLLVFLTPLALYSKWNEFMIARTYGYNALYYGTYSTQGGYMQILLYMFFPALICFLVGSRYSKPARTIAYLIFGAYALLGFLSGDRGNWLYSLIILIWLHSHYEKISKWQYVIILAIAVGGLYVLDYVTSMRDTGLTMTGMNMDSVFGGEKSPLTDAFFEMGGSMGIITYFMNAGENIYPYGNTYITAILGAVSSRVLSLFGLKQVFISSWFSQDYLHIDWGTGFSMMGEAFVNGGYYGGWIYMFIIGALIGKLLQYAASQSWTGSPLKMFVSVAALNVVMSFARNHSYLVVKELVYGVCLIAIIVVLLTRMQSAKEPDGRSEQC